MRQPREGEPPPAPEPLPGPVLDSHCHLDLMGSPVEEALAAARSVGVERVVTVGIDVPTSQWSADTALAYDSVAAAVAIHPNEAGRGVASDEALREIERLAGLPQVVAVGETGLDHFRTGPEGHRVQEESFRAHIAIAKATGNTLMIHDRDAHADVLRVLAEEGPPERVVFHCFSGGPELARVCAARGYVMSFAGNITFKNAQPLRDALTVAPLDLVLVETDAPFLTPMPYRGAPNAPYLVPLTVRAIAQVKGLPLGEVVAAVRANGLRVLPPSRE